MFSSGTLLKEPVLKNLYFNLIKSLTPGLFSTVLPRLNGQHLSSHFLAVKAG